VGSTGQFITFGPFQNAGALAAAPHVFHYSAGTSTLLNAYTDRAKSVTAAQPLVGDANGVASAFFDGLYKIVVKTSDEVTTLFTWDNFDLTEAIHRLEGSATFDPTSMLPGQHQTSTGITVTGAAFGDYVLVSAPYDLQGLLVQANVTAADTVKIRLSYPVNYLYATATYDPGSLVDGAGETSSAITVTGAALNDAVLVFPPYDLQGITVTGYVSAVNTVKIRVQNESTATVDLASGSWQVAVVPRGTAIDLASGTWKVRVLQQ
jgi:hypothetical protein